MIPPLGKKIKIFSKFLFFRVSSVLGVVFGAESESAKISEKFSQKMALFDHFLPQNATFFYKKLLKNAGPRILIPPNPLPD